MSDYCCPALKEKLLLQCDTCEDREDCPDIVIHRYESDIWAKPKWGIPILSLAGGGFIQIYFCPWCGSMLNKDDK